MTRCADFEDLLPVHAVDEASVEEALAVEEHVAECGSCREGLTFYREVRAAARRDREALPPLPHLRRPGVVGGLPWAPRLAAAAALIAAGLLIGRWTAPAPVEAPPVAVAAVSAVGSLGVPARRALSVFSPHAKRFLARAAEKGEGPGAR